MSIFSLMYLAFLKVNHYNNLHSQNHSNVKVMIRTIVFLYGFLERESTGCKSPNTEKILTTFKLRQ